MVILAIAPSRAAFTGAVIKRNIPTSAYEAIQMCCYKYGQVGCVPPVLLDVLQPFFDCDKGIPKENANNASASTDDRGDVCVCHVALSSSLAMKMPTEILRLAHAITASRMLTGWD